VTKNELRKMTLEKKIEFLQHLADKDKCDGDCDNDPPYNTCSECESGRVLNQISEDAYEVINNWIDAN